MKGYKKVSMKHKNIAPAAKFIHTEKNRLGDTVELRFDNANLPFIIKQI